VGAGTREATEAMRRMEGETEVVESKGRKVA